MQTIIIKLSPVKLTNPDLDLRYLVEDYIEEISNGAIQANGYDYLDNDEMGIWLKTESANGNYPVIVKLLQEEKFKGNNLSLSAEIYISENETEDIENCTLVFSV